MQTCTICNKTFTSPRALSGHSRMHGQSNGTRTVSMCCCVLTQSVIESKALNKFQDALLPCKTCGLLFRPRKDKKYFCSQSCSAITANSNRATSGWTHSNDSRQQIANSLEKYYLANPKKKSSTVKVQKLYSKKSYDNKELPGLFSKIFTCTCKHCKAKFVSRIAKQYCLLHKNLYSVSSKSGYKFTFNVYHYPDLFDIELVKSVGWYSRGGTAGKWNPNGLSRDHKISVTSAIANNYDPFYITHPLNCELMTWTENNKKKTKSSMTYEELINQVNAHEIAKAH